MNDIAQLGLGNVGSFFQSIKIGIGPGVCLDTLGGGVGNDLLVASTGGSRLCA